MNTKQIERLEDQASLYASRQTTDLDEWEFIFRKKFAELIVKECMKVADEGMAQVTLKVEWPSYHIKKHFGVEE